MQLVHSAHHDRSLQRFDAEGSAWWPFLDAVVMPGVLYKKHDLFETQKPTRSVRRRSPCDLRQAAEPPKQVKRHGILPINEQSQQMPECGAHRFSRGLKLGAPHRIQQRRKSLDDTIVVQISRPLFDRSNQCSQKICPNRGTGSLLQPRREVTHVR